MLLRNLLSGLGIFRGWRVKVIDSFLHLFIHSFTKYLLKVYRLQATILDIGITELKKK